MKRRAPLTQRALDAISEALGFRQAGEDDGLTDPQGLAEAERWLTGMYRQRADRNKARR